MKRLGLILIAVLMFASCEQTPRTGSLLITLEYDGYAEENVEVWLYDSRTAFDNFEFLEKQVSDENGEVFWGGLEPGMYYIEAEREKSSLLTLYAMDSTEVLENAQRNKRMILFPDE